MSETERAVRFMLLVKADADSEAGVPPDEAALAELCKFNEAMLRAGVLLAADGLKASSEGARVRFAARKPSVVNGPFAGSQDLVAGYWLIQVPSKAEAVEWAKRAPVRAGEIEVRALFEK